jgi:hypothetical protein
MGANEGHNICDRESGIIVCIIITLEADVVEGRSGVVGPRSEPHDPAARHVQRSLSAYSAAPRWASLLKLAIATQRTTSNQISQMRNGVAAVGAG